MGCDIHFYVEKKDGDQWVSADNWTDDKYEPGTLSIDYDDRFYNGRNYNLFAILADVRNGVGFAGCDTGDAFVPIASPRGLPSDVSPQIQRESGEYGSHGHSHSYFTVAELKAYDWAQSTKHRGWVDAWNFEVWRTEGKPHNWSGGVSGPSIEHVSNQEVARLIDSGDLHWTSEPPDKNSWDHRTYTLPLSRSMQSVGFPTGTLGADIAKGRQYYTLVEWEEPYSVSANEFLTETLPKLEALGSPDDVRIVFWFDN